MRVLVALVVGASAAQVLLLAPAPARGQSMARDSGAFLTLLGSDTLAVERFVRAGDSVRGELLARAPLTRRLVYSARLDRGGAVTSYTLTRLTTMTDPTSAPAVRVAVDFHRDSATVVIHNGDSTTTRTFAVPRGTIPAFEPSFGLYELVIVRARAAKGASVPFALLYPGDDIYPGTAVARAGGDSVWIQTAADTVRAAVDTHGCILGLTDPGGTLQAVATRIPWPDFEHWATMFGARDAMGHGLGALSPRDTVRGSVGAVHILVDYGRPAKRGRVIFGNVVPWNRVWRTGANAATTLMVDQDVLIGDTHIPAGTYTLFSVPAPTGWMLIVSRKTGEWGTEYDPHADLARIPMQAAALGEPVERFTITLEPQTAEPQTASAATLALSWDTTVARVPIRPADARSAGATR